MASEMLGATEMARPPRLTLAGELHLVLLRGHSDAPVFVDDSDRTAFVGFLAEAAARNDVSIHAWALLEDRVVLLLTPGQGGALGRLMQSLGRRYVADFNRRHGRRGTLWDGRFRNSIVDAESLLLPATVYVETLPVAAGLVVDAPSWPWSSAAHHIGRSRDPIVSDHALYWRLGNTPFEREHAHTIAVASADVTALEQTFSGATQRSAVVGPAGFTARIAAALHRPVAVRPRGRPRRTNPVKTVPN